MYMYIVCMNGGHSQGGQPASKGGGPPTPQRNPGNGRQIRKW